MRYCLALVLVLLMSSQSDAFIFGILGGRGRENGRDGGMIGNISTDSTHDINFGRRNTFYGPVVINQTSRVDNRRFRFVRRWRLRR